MKLVDLYLTPKTAIMHPKIIILGLFLSLLAFSCTEKPEELQLDPETEALVEILKDELKSLSTNPLSWSDEELRWLDPLAGKSVIALGEATHGTAEFFKAKHRIFKYLAENHGYKVFAFEADFGESIFINEAVQKGNTNEIESLMRSKMHFWTWKTEEVRDLLKWMCEYNKGKPESERVQYVGMDCQFNTYHPDMVMEYLDGKGLPFETFADSILGKAKIDTQNKFDDYTSESFETYLGKLDALVDSMEVYRDVIIASSSDKDMQLHSRILEVVRQVSEVKYYYQAHQFSINYRDKYMAENTVWLSEYYAGKKIVVWAHNGHIADSEYGNTGSMGNYLDYELGDAYSTIGFLFSQGTFTAVGMEGDQYTSLATQTLDTIPRENSLNAIMSYTREPAFSIELRRLQAYVNWFVAFNKDMEYFHIGSVYNNIPGSYYSRFDPFYYDYLIYFDKSTASMVL